MTESNEQSQAERMELPLTKDSNELALSKHFPTIGSCHLINVQIFGRSAGTGGSCQT